MAFTTCEVVTFYDYPARTEPLEGGPLFSFVDEAGLTSLEEDAIVELWYLRGTIEMHVAHAPHASTASRAAIHALTGGVPQPTSRPHDALGSENCPVGPPQLGLAVTLTTVPLDVSANFGRPAGYQMDNVPAVRVAGFVEFQGTIAPADAPGTYRFVRKAWVRESRVAPGGARPDYMLNRRAVSANPFDDETEDYTLDTSPSAVQTTTPVDGHVWDYDGPGDILTSLAPLGTELRLEGNFTSRLVVGSDPDFDVDGDLVLDECDWQVRLRASVVRAGPLEPASPGQAVRRPTGVPGIALTNNSIVGGR